MSQPWDPSFYKNYSTGVLSGTYSSVDKNIYFQSGSTGAMPDLPFNLTVYNITDYPLVYNDPNVEIIRATGTLNNGYSVIRGYSNTTGSPKDISLKTYVAHQSISSDVFNDHLTYFRPAIIGGFYLIDDFTWSDTGSSPVGWIVNTINGSNLSISGLASNPGVLSFNISSGQNSAASIRLSQSGISINSGITEISFMVSPTDIPITNGNITYRIGMVDSTGIERPSNGIYFEINGSSSATGLYLVKCSGNAFGSGQSDLPDNESKILTRFSEYKIKINSSTNTANFYINGIEVSGSPMSGGFPIFLEKIHPYYSVSKDSGSGVFSSRLDYLEIKQTFQNKARY